MTTTDSSVDPTPVDPTPVDPTAVAPERAAPVRARRRPDDVMVLAAALMLVGQALVLADVHTPVLRPVLAGVLLVGVPVLVLARRMFGSLRRPLLATMYALGVTVLGLIVIPLALNTVLPWLGVGAPLARPVLVGASTVVDLVLLLWPSRTPLLDGARLRRVPARVWRARLDPAVALAVLAVVAAVAGAVRLNNRLGGGVAVLAHVLAVVSVGLAVVLRRSRSQSRDTAVVYLAGLALLLGTSLRGWFITGHDIQNEYLAFLYTNTSGHWVMSAYPEPYNACLSVNILPSVLVDYLGVTGVFVFKVLMQVLFAVVPVCVYLAARRIAESHVATLAAAVFMIFPTFYTDMPFLVRQEVAYLFVALTLLAATQRGWRLRYRQLATFAFGVGVILSHYSTTYVMIITLLLGLVGTAAGRLWRLRRNRQLARWRSRVQHGGGPRDQRPARHPVLLQPLVVLALAVSAWAWSSPATNSGGHLAETVNKLTEAFIHGNAETGSSDLKYSVFGGGGPSDQERFSQFLDDAQKVRDAAEPGSFAFTDPTGTTARPDVVEREYLPLTAAGEKVQDAGVNVRGVNALLRTASAGLFQLLLIIGLIALALHARATRRVTREQFWLVLGSVGALASVVVVPGLSANYGVLRAFQQTLLFAAPIVAIGLVTATAKLRRLSLPVTGAVVTAMGLVLTGAQPALLGGYFATLSQSNSGQYYDLLYVRSPQLAAARWLGRDLDGKGFRSVAAADIVSITRLQMFLPRAVAVTANYLPLQLTRDTYLFMGPQTTDRKQATVFYTGNLITYRYPVRAVDGQLDLVYSTSGTRVYR